MGKQVLTGARCFLDGYDVSGDLNALAFQRDAELIDVTTIGDTGRARAGGLKSVTASLAGLWEAGAGEIDPVLSERVGVADTILTMCPEGGDAGDRAFTAQVAIGEYVPVQGEVGDALEFSVTAQGVTDLYRGTVLASVVGAAATGTTATQNLGAPGASQYVRAALHVYAVTGTPTLTVVVESDDNSGATSPSTRLTFGAKTAVGAELVSAVGVGGGEVHWRTSYTITGVGTVSFVVVLSIQ